VPSGRRATTSVKVPPRSIQSCQRPALGFEAMVIAIERMPNFTSWEGLVRSPGGQPVVTARVALHDPNSATQLPHRRLQFDHRSGVDFGRLPGVRARIAVEVVRETPSGEALRRFAGQNPPVRLRLFEGRVGDWVGDFEVAHAAAA